MLQALPLTAAADVELGDVQQPVCRHCGEERVDDLFVPCLCHNGWIHRSCLNAERCRGTLAADEHAMSRCPTCKYEYKVSSDSSAIEERRASKWRHLWVKLLQRPWALQLAVQGGLFVVTLLLACSAKVHLASHAQEALALYSTAVLCCTFPVWLGHALRCFFLPPAVHDVLDDQTHSTLPDSYLHTCGPSRGPTDVAAALRPLLCGCCSSSEDAQDKSLVADANLDQEADALQSSYCSVGLLSVACGACGCLVVGGVRLWISTGCITPGTFSLDMLVDLLMLSLLLMVDLISLIFLHIAVRRFVRAMCLKDIAEHYMVLDITAGTIRSESDGSFFTHHLQLLPSVLRMRVEVKEVLAPFTSVASRSQV